MAAAHPMGPYHHPVIGWQSDLDHMSVKQLKDWYQKWYVPNNAVIIVVGNVKADEVYELAKKYFNKLSARPLPTALAQQEIAPMGEKQIKVHTKANLPYGIWGFAVPSLKTAPTHRDAYALWLASAVLSGGKSARFPKELVRDQHIAASVNAHYDILKAHDTQFLITGVPAQGKTMTELAQAVMAQIERLQQQPVSEQALTRIQNQLIAEEVFDKDSMSHQAILLGILESVGLSWRLADQLIDNIKQVTPEDIQRVASTYLISKNLTFAELVPEQVTH